VSWTATRQPWAPPKSEREQANQRLFQETGLRPLAIITVAGAIVYRRHSWLARRIWAFVIRRIGGPADVNRDYEFTDWQQLRRDTLKFLSNVAPRAETAADGISRARPLKPVPLARQTN
jgi:menaquinone-dependent protoporphyrinogen IX oxidase